MNCNYMFMPDTWDVRDANEREFTNVIPADSVGMMQAQNNAISYTSPALTACGKVYLSSLTNTNR